MLSRIRSRVHASQAGGTCLNDFSNHPRDTDMNDRTTKPAAERRTSEHATKAKKPFLKPALERHESLPKVTGFTF